MNNKLLILILILFMVFIGLGVVSASESDEELNISSDVVEVNEISEDIDSDVSDNENTNINPIEYKDVKNTNKLGQTEDDKLSYKTYYFYEEDVKDSYYYGEPVKISVSYTASEYLGSTGSDEAYVTVAVKGIKYQSVQLYYSSTFIGTQIATFHDMPVGVHTLDILATSGPIKGSRITRNLTILPNDFLVCDDKEINVNQDGYYYATFKTVYGDNIANKQLKFLYDGKTEYAYTNSDGVAEIPINFGDVGTYTISISYEGDKNFSNSEANAIITVKTPTKITSLINTVKNNKYYSVKLTTPDGTPVSEKMIDFVINGLSYTAKTDSNGVAKLKITVGNGGIYNIYSNFVGDNEFTKSSLQTKITVKNPTKIIPVTSKVKKSKSKRSIQFIFAAANGQTLAHKKLKLTINKKSYTAKTDAYGRITFKVKLPNKVKKYNYKLNFAGDTANYKLNYKGKVAVVKKVPQSKITYFVSKCHDSCGSKVLWSQKFSKWEFDKYVVKKGKLYKKYYALYTLTQYPCYNNYHKQFAQYGNYPKKYQTISGVDYKGKSHYKTKFYRNVKIIKTGIKNNKLTKKTSGKYTVKTVKGTSMYLYQSVDVFAYKNGKQLKNTYNSKNGQIKSFKYLSKIYYKTSKGKKKYFDWGYGTEYYNQQKFDIFDKSINIYKVDVAILI